MHYTFGERLVKALNLGAFETNCMFNNHDKVYWGGKVY